MFDRTQTDDDAAVMEPAVKRLAAMEVARIKAFENRLAWSLPQLDAMEHVKNIGESPCKDGDGYFVVDSFLYARCLVVARGRGFYEAVLADPARMPEDSEFESLLYLAGEPANARPVAGLTMTLGSAAKPLPTRRDGKSRRLWQRPLIRNRRH